METLHTLAIETRLKWLRWAKSGDASRWWSDMNFLEILPAYTSVLEAGDTFFMNSRFCELVDFARQSIPDDIVWENDWLQAKQGWMWIAEPFLVPHIISTEVPTIDVRISAIGWFPINPGTMVYRGMSTDPNQATQIVSDSATEFLCFQDVGDRRKTGFSAWSYFKLENGDKLIDRIHHFERMAEQSPEPQGAYPSSRKTDMMHEIRWVYAAFHLMAQKLAITVQHNTDRATRRREMREKQPLPVPPFIKVVTLRRYEEDRKRQFGDKPMPIDWQWQWAVRGHWRNQWYPSENMHKQVWIESYIKGPEDKPMKPEGHRLFIARR